MAKMLFVKKYIQECYSQTAATILFDAINLEHDSEVWVDFTTVENIGMPFAEEYVKLKNESKKIIKETGITPGIKVTLNNIDKAIHPHENNYVECGNIIGFSFILGLLLGCIIGAIAFGIANSVI